MERMSSCAMSIFSETRTVLSVPSGVANLSAIRRTSLRSSSLGSLGGESEGNCNYKRHKVGRKLYIILYNKYNTISPSQLSKLQWLTNMKWQFVLLPSQFILTRVFRVAVDKFSL